MEEIKVGEYVRTYNGNIIRAIKVGDILSDDCIYYFGRYGEEVIGKSIVTKHSPNIIDLIEVGDYVNGYLVNEVYKTSDNKVLRVEIEKDTLQGHIIDSNNVIKTILTKEQFKSVMYEVK